MNRDALLQIGIFVDLGRETQYIADMVNLPPDQAEKYVNCFRYDIFPKISRQNKPINRHTIIEEIDKVDWDFEDRPPENPHHIYTYNSVRYRVVKENNRTLMIQSIDYPSRPAVVDRYFFFKNFIPLNS